MRFLKGNQLTYITADEPQYGNLTTVPFFPHITTDTGYFGFHDRNKENWFKKGIETSLRFAYRYSDDELKHFIPCIHDIDKKTKIKYAMFNNCQGCFAIRDAIRLRELITS